MTHLETRIQYGADARERQEGRPDVRPAHAVAGASGAGRHGRHRHAARRAVPGRRGAGRSARSCSTTTSSRPSSAWRRTSSTAPASRPASWCCARRAARTRRAARQGAVHQRRPRVPRGAGAELPAARARREDRLDVPRLTRTCPASRGSSTREELAANDDNLNIRRYADNTPPPEPQDVRAHLLGGVPRRGDRGEEAAARRVRDRGDRSLRGAGADDPAYVDFLPDEAAAGAARLGELARPREEALRAEFGKWWEDGGRATAGVGGGHARSSRARPRPPSARPR